MLKPQKLNKGDTVTSISLSWGGAGLLPGRYNKAKSQFEKIFDCKVIESPNSLAPSDFLYNNPKARADDLMWAFKNPDVKAIISNIGGDDSIRILPYIDFDVIRSNPKIFMGYSDTTITNFICYRAGLKSFYGPAFLSQFAEVGGIMPYVKSSVEKTLFNNEPIGIIPENRDGFTYEFIDWFTPESLTTVRKIRPTDGWHWIQGSGTVNGKLIGGCMEVIEMLKGTTLWNPEDFNNSILFLEISEENPTPSQVLFWLRNYGACGILKKVNAILFGRPQNENSKEYEKSILKVLAEYGRTDMPVITNMDFGHTDPIMVLPIGINAEIDCDNKTFTITESAVL